MSKRSHVYLEGFNSDVELANAFNGFYTRFDKFDFGQEIQMLRMSLVGQKCIKVMD